MWDQLGLTLPPKTKGIHVWIPYIETKEPTIVKVNKLKNYAALRNVFHIYIYENKTPCNSNE
jgi:hypothetical protein